MNEEVIKIINPLNKDLKNKIIKIFEIDNQYYESIINNNVDLLKDALEKDAPLGLFDLEENLSFSEEEILDKHYLKIRNLFIDINIKDLKEEIKLILLNYLFHKKEMLPLRVNFFQNENDYGLIKKYLDLYLNTLGYLNYEKDMIVIALLNNPNKDINDKFLENYEKHLDLKNFKIKHYKILNEYSYKKAFNILKIKYSKEEIIKFIPSFYDVKYNLRFVSNTEINEKNNSFLIDEYSKYLNIDNEESKILIIFHKINDLGNNFFRNDKIITLEKMIIDLIQIKAMNTIDINHFVSFLKNNHIPSKYYEHILIKQKIMDNVEIKFNNNKITKI